MNEKRIISALTDGDSDALKEVYHHYRQPFIRWSSARFSSMDRAVIEDVYSDVVLDFYENIRKGKYQKQASLKTYLFTLGRNKLINIAKRSAMQSSKESEIISDLEERTTINPILEQQSDENNNIVHNKMKELCGDCQQILTLFYYHNLSMAEIAEKMGYKNSNVSKSKKNVCYNKLKELLQEAYSKADFF
jgi:RNA polymerase sigma factor (sigma-70 family)